MAVHKLEADAASAQPTQSQPLVPHDPTGGRDAPFCFFGKHGLKVCLLAETILHNAAASKAADGRVYVNDRPLALSDVQFWTRRLLGNFWRLAHAETVETWMAQEFGPFGGAA